MGSQGMGQRCAARKKDLDFDIQVLQISGAAEEIRTPGLQVRSLFVSVISRGYSIIINNPFYAYLSLTCHMVTINSHFIKNCLKSPSIV